MTTSSAFDDLLRANATFADAHSEELQGFEIGRAHV